MAGVAGARFGPDAIPSAGATSTPWWPRWGRPRRRPASKGSSIRMPRFPGAASGRALSPGREEAMTQLLFEPRSRRLLGAGIVGVIAGELTAEIVPAREMGSDGREHRTNDPSAPDARRDDRVRVGDGRGRDHEPDAPAKVYA
jgi:pyruvate/2-oxoglutarate dehydrogenase complex dihydrolipoamide dehydrogenase (E3) component